MNNLNEHNSPLCGACWWNPPRSPLRSGRQSTFWNKDTEAVHSRPVCKDSELHRGVLVTLSDHLESDFCRKRAWLDVTDVDAGFLCRTAGDADAHPLGAHQTEENLLLLDFFTSNGRQACDAALLLLQTERKVRLTVGWGAKTPKKEGTSVSYPWLGHKLVDKLPLERFIWWAGDINVIQWEHRWSLHVTACFIKQQLVNDLTFSLGSSPRLHRQRKTKQIKIINDSAAVKQDSPFMLISHSAVVGEWGCVWRTPDFKWHNLLGLDEADDLLVDAGGDGVSVDAHNLITNLHISTGWEIMDDAFTFNIHQDHGWFYCRSNNLHPRVLNTPATVWFIDRCDWFMLI